MSQHVKELDISVFDCTDMFSSWTCWMYNITRLLYNQYCDNCIISLYVCRPGVLKDLKTMGSVSLFIFFITLLVLARQVSKHHSFVNMTQCAKKCIGHNIVRKAFFVALRQRHKIYFKRWGGHNGTQLFYKHFTFLWTGLFGTFAQACDLLQGSRPSSPLCPPLSLNMRAKLNWHRFSVDVLCFLGYHPSALTPQSRCLGREESPQRLGTCNWGSLAGFILGHCHLKRRTRLFWKHNFAAVNSYFILDCTLSKAFRFEFMLKRHKLVV